MIIELTKGYRTSINFADSELVKAFKWYASVSSYHVYAVTNVGKHPNRRKIYLHRLITGAAFDQQVHHKDGDTMNNRRYNLEVCSQQVNLSYRIKRGDL